MISSPSSSFWASYQPFEKKIYFVILRLPWALKKISKFQIFSIFDDGFFRWLFPIFKKNVKIKTTNLDVEKRYEVEVNTFQSRVNRLQSELDKSTQDMKKHLSEYKNLMNVKQSLEKVNIKTFNSNIFVHVTLYPIF